MQGKVYRSEGTVHFEVENSTSDTAHDVRLITGQEPIRLLDPRSSAPGMGFSFELEPATIRTYFLPFGLRDFARLNRTATLLWRQGGEQFEQPVDVQDEDADVELAKRLFRWAKSRNLTWASGVLPSTLESMLLNSEAVKGLRYRWQLVAALELLESRGLIVVPSNEPIGALMNQSQDELEFVFSSRWERAFE